MKQGTKVKQRGGDIYIIAQVDTCKYALISLRDGNRFYDPVTIGGTYLDHLHNRDLTPAEFALLTPYTSPDDWTEVD